MTFLLLYTFITDSIRVFNDFTKILTSHATIKFSH